LSKMIKSARTEYKEKKGKRFLRNPSSPCKKKKPQ